MSLAGTMPAACLPGLLSCDADQQYLLGDSLYFETHTPMDLLEDLRRSPSHPFLIPEAPSEWITLSDAALLMEEIDRTEPAAPVVSPISSYWPFDQTSSVGNEALFLLEGYRAGKYPPRLCSLHYFKPDRTEVRAWWNDSGRFGLIEQGEAIRIVQAACPDLLAYPSDGLPPRSIRAERSANGWHLAFIQEGSGLPILSARCYLVTDDRAIIATGRIDQSLMVLPEQFSPVRCG